MKTKRYFLLFIFSGALLLLNSCKQESLKRTERDISGEEPFKSIVGKTLTTKQSCYIGNYDDSADDVYTMAMNEDYFLNAKPITS